MISKRIEAIPTSAVCAATLHLDGDDVERRVVAGTAALRIDADRARFIDTLTSVPMTLYFDGVPALSSPANG